MKGAFFTLEMSLLFDGNTSFFRGDIDTQRTGRRKEKPSVFAVRLPRP